MNPSFQRAALGAGVLFLALGAQAAGTSSAPASGKQAAAGNGASEPAMPSGDRSFLNQAALGGLAEVELGKLAQQKAENPEVKKFAEHMVQDHGKANEELESLAEGKGVSLPKDLDRSHQAKSQKLAKLSGAEFDKAYMKQMVQDHKKTVADFRKASKGAKDPAVKSFASGKLPRLEEHLRMAQATEKSVSGARGADKTAMRSDTTGKAKP